MKASTKRIELSDEERAALQLLASSKKTRPRLANRARIVLAAGEGLSLAEVSRRTGLCTLCCREWCKRFVEKRFAGLADKPCRERRQGTTEQQLCKIMALVCAMPVDGGCQWSIRDLSEATGYSTRAIHEMLRGGVRKPKPRKTRRPARNNEAPRWRGTLPEPGLAARQAALAGLYMGPSVHALVLGVEEKSRIQSLGRAHALLPMRPGNAKGLAAAFERDRTACLLAALAAHEETIEGSCADGAGHENFPDFLTRLCRSHPGRDLHIIVHTFNCHADQEVSDRVHESRRLHMHATATRTFWLQQSENWFSIFAKSGRKDGVWQSRRQHVAQIMQYIRCYKKEQALPFIWTHEEEPLPA